MSFDSFEQPQGTREEGFKYHWEEIRELEKPLQNLLEQLREQIDAGTYRVIIGDDASGRIPALIMGRVLKALYKENNYQKPKLRFIAGKKVWDMEEKDSEEYKALLSRYMSTLSLETEEEEKDDAKADDSAKTSRTLKSLLESMRSIFAEQKHSRKILVVTDTIASGQTLETLVTALGDADIPFDVATVGITGDMGNARMRRRTESMWGGKIYLGQVEEPKIYYLGKSLSGVYKKPYESSIFSEPLHTPHYNDQHKDKEENIRFCINTAREDARHLSDELIKWYKTKEPPK